ncbi:hypothetical protein BASA60_003962 [Batrachochytrium salamandrivorans]|nr:hypothetical protein BASA60_003962 [Batrachochytrium salamandrivorans]
MRVKVLVVAAMVITSVNASWRRRFGSLFEQDDDSRPKSKARLDEPTSECAGTRTITELTRHALFPISPQDSLDDSSEFMYTDSEGIVTMSTDEKIKAKALRVRLMQEWINLNPGSIPELKEIKAKYTGLEEDYRRVWKEFDESKCVTEEFEHWDPKHILDSGYSPRWHYENDLIVFDEQ